MALGAGREQLLKFAAPYVPRVWAIEGARGLDRRSFVTAPEQA